MLQRARLQKWRYESIKQMQHINLPGKNSSNLVIGDQLVDTAYNKDRPWVLLNCLNTSKLHRKQWRKKGDKWQCSITWFKGQMDIKVNLKLIQPLEVNSDLQQDSLFFLHHTRTLCIHNADFVFIMSLFSAMFVDINHVYITQILVYYWLIL